MKDLKQQLLSALSHPEAEDGLYFHNLTTLHEEDEREAIVGDPAEILDALQLLIQEGKVEVEEDTGEKKELIFRLAK